MIQIRHIPHIIHVRPEADIATLIEEVLSTASREVYLIVEAESKILENDLNLKLLTREIAAAGKEIVLVSPNPHIEQVAGRAGLRMISRLPEEFKEYGDTFSSPTSRVPARKVVDIAAPAPIKEMRGESEAGGEESAVEEAEGEEEEEGIFPVEEGVVRPARRGGAPRFPQFSIPQFRTPRFHLRTFSFRPTSRIFTIGVAAAGMALLFVLFFAFVPRATFEITPKKEKVTFETDTRAAKTQSSLSIAENAIPAEAVSVEARYEQEFLSSGKETRADKATGVLIVYNQYSSSPQTLVETTRFVSQEGKVFRTTKTIVIPGAIIEEGKILPSSIEVEVVAVEAGPEYNIGPSTFSIPGFKGTPKYTSFYAKSTSPMTGGFVGEVRVVSDDDLKRAREAVNTEIEKKLGDEFKKKLPEGFLLIENAKRDKESVIEESKKAGEIADSFRVSARKVSEAILFRESDVRELVSRSFEQRIADFSLFTKGNESLRYEITRADFEKGALSLRVFAEVELIPKIDPGKIKEDLKGKTELEVRRYFSEERPDIERSRVTFFPRFLVRSVPSNIRNIEVKIKTD